MKRRIYLFMAIICAAALLAGCTLGPVSLYGGWLSVYQPPVDIVICLPGCEQYPVP